MNFNTSPSLMHPSAAQPSAPLNHNGIHSNQNSLPASTDDPLNSIRLSLADLSVGGNGYDLGQQQQQQHQSQPQQYNYEYNPNVQNIQSMQSSNHSTPQIRDVIGNWGSSGITATAATRRQPTSNVVSHSHQYSNSDAKKRGESIDVFLSRSPSQSLGTEFLKFRNEEHSKAIPPLSLGMNQRSHSIGGGVSPHRLHQQVSSSFNETRAQSVTNHSRQSSYSDSVNIGDNGSHGTSSGRDTSPSCSVTGTSASSRSGSPSWNGRGSIPSGGHTINEYKQNTISASSSTMSNGVQQRGQYHHDLNSSYESFSSGHQLYSGNNNNYENFQAQGNGVNSNMGFVAGNAVDSSRDNYHHLNNASYANLGSNNGVDEYQFSRPGMPPGYSPNLNESGILNQQPTPKQQQIPKEAKPQQQIFYMAVPTDDGQGQVLQPIQMQMVQIPGQPNAFMLPTAPQGSSIVGVAPMTQGNPMTITSSLHNAPHVHNDRKSYAHMQGSRHQLDQSTSGQYGEDNYAQGYTDDTGAYNDKQYRSGRRDSINSTTNDIVANLYASPQRPPLRELLGHVRRLSRDQVGCRLLQQALDEEGASAASMILKEGLSFWGEAMVDPFGNYLFQKILEKITAEERIVLVQNVSPRLVNASLNLHGTRSVQKVVELCANDEKETSAALDADDNHETASEILTRSLKPAAARLCIDSHGNHVIQRILLKLPYKYSHFVFDAVANSVGDVARHRHGCCVIQRCLDSPPSSARSNLVQRIVEKSLELMQDAYGNYVVQYVLDVCSDEDVYAVCESVVGKVTLLAIQKFSSNVMEKCLERCTDKVRELYLVELSDSERIRELMMDPFGNYVIQRALAVSTHAQAVQLVEAMKPHLCSSTGGGIKNTAGGRRILAKISKRFPNFSLGDEFGDNDGLQKSGHKKNTNGRHDNGLSSDSSARFNRRVKSDDIHDPQRRLDASRHARSEEKDIH